MTVEQAINFIKSLSGGLLEITHYDTKGHGMFMYIMKYASYIGYGEIQDYTNGMGRLPNNEM